MKRSGWLVIALCIVLLVVSAATAQDYKRIASFGGVEVTAAIEPLGHNNLMSAFIRFVNHNQYKVNVAWTPVITCQGAPSRNGYGEPFSMDAGATYVARLWRSSTCGPGSIRNIAVEMTVKRADAY
jgi:hypothetical protein